MTIWDSLKKILKSEAADVGTELGKARDKFDEALTRKEEEMAATPKERMDMILDDIQDSDDKFEAIRDKAEGKTSAATAEAEVAETVRGSQPSDDEPPLPAATAEVVEAADPKAAEPAVSEVAEVSPVEAETVASDSTAEISDAIAGGPGVDGPSVDEMVQQRVERDSRRAAADAKFAEQKERAGDILDELRGELGIDDPTDSNN